jgi:hypothetical protein
VVQSIFRNGISFEEAIQALQLGNRIRRKSERKGYAKFVVSDGKNKVEKFGRYWVDDKEIEANDYCSFCLEDVLAGDWIIDVKDS